MPSEPYRGPHAIFTDEELRYIRGILTFRSEILAVAITSKINHALGSDPKWRQPISEAEERAQRISSKK